jgi:cation diffusion facilitator family transporter
LLIGICLLIIKLLAWYITASNSILSDALESIVNIIAGAFTWYSLWLSSKPKDKEHPYGHGKIEFIAAGFEGSLIIIAGIAIIAKSIYNFKNPQIINSLDAGIYLTFFAGLVNYIAGDILVKKGKMKRSSAMIASGKHLKSDAYTSVGLIVGLLLVIFTHQYILDNVIAIIFASLIIWMGIKIIKNSLSGIMDENDETIINELSLIFNACRNENIIDIHNLRVIRYGTQLHIDCHATLPYYFNLQQAHDILDNIDKTVNKKMGASVEFFIHTDPCIESSCFICEKHDCTVRKHKFVKKIDWNSDNLLKNKKHGLTY